MSLSDVWFLTNVTFWCLTFDSCHIVIYHFWLLSNTEFLLLTTVTFKFLTYNFCHIQILNFRLCHIQNFYFWLQSHCNLWLLSTDTYIILTFDTCHIHNTDFWHLSHTEFLHWHLSHSDFDLCYAKITSVTLTLCHLSLKSLWNFIFTLTNTFWRQFWKALNQPHCDLEYF